MQRIGLSQVIKPFILLVDLVLLNLLFIGLHRFNIIVFEKESILQIWVIVLFCFFFYGKFYKPKLYSRITNKYKIISNIFLFVLKNGISAYVIYLFFRGKVQVWDFVYFYSCVFLVFLGAHFCMRRILKIYRKKGGNSRTCIFVGNSENLSELYAEMTENLASGYIIKGYFADSPSTKYPESLIYLGNTTQVVDFLEKHPIEQIYYSLSSGKDENLHNIVNYCENHLIRFYSVPFIRNSFQRNAVLGSRGNVPVIYLRPEPLSQLENICLKRLFDIVFSLLFLLTLFPLILLFVSIGIKITSPGPIFFRQKRNGQYGKVFWCYKFRSMKSDNQTEAQQATQKDPRVTPFGKFLRKSSIDELPQFINVLKGDMSVVGPRPHMMQHTSKYGELINKYMVRHFVKPGITGWAQVTGFRGETKAIDEMEGRIRQDIWYIEHWSFVLDLYIILLTVYRAIKGDEKAY